MRISDWSSDVCSSDLAAIFLGAIIGHFWPAWGEALKPLGDGFIKLVKMIISPVIFLTVVTGIAGLKEIASVGRVAGKAFAYFLVRSEERRGGKECVRTFRSRWLTYT